MRKTLRNCSLLIVLTLSFGTCMAQTSEMSFSADSVAENKRPHHILIEYLGRGITWSINYGYSFYSFKGVEITTSIGANFYPTYVLEYTSSFPIGLYVRYGSRFRGEVGIAGTPIVNWCRFTNESYYDSTESIMYEVPAHDFTVAPSVGFLYVSKKSLFEFGFRFTPIFFLKELPPLLWGGVYVGYRFRNKVSGK